MKSLIQDKMKLYQCESVQDEENAIKEITQEVVLYSLREAGFFEKASFHGGTCLRIVHGLDRFSEDLDFALKSSDSKFDLSVYLEKAIETMRVYGYEIDVSGEDKVNQSVRSRFLKDNSIKKLLSFDNKHDLRKKIQIKVEVDINPPKGAIHEVNYLDFPMDFMIGTHDKASLFAGKCHALLYRKYVKGRDWYDYLWYLRNGVKVNLDMLKQAIDQQGPWKGSEEKVSEIWLKSQLEAKISSLDWSEVREDVERFLHPGKRKVLDLWSREFFIKKTQKAIFSGR